MERDERYDVLVVEATGAGLVSLAQACNESRATIVKVVRIGNEFHALILEKPRKEAKSFFD